MPWNNQGSGGWRGGGGGGPWGQGPGGGGPRQQPPDLEEIIKRGQERLRTALPSGGGGKMTALIAVALLGIIYAWNAIYTVQPAELGVELRFGKPKGQISEPGLHAMLWPIDTVEKAGIDERQISIGGGRRGVEGGQGGQGLMLTGDQNIVNVQFALLYVVASPIDYLFQVATPDETLTQVAESAMREVVGRRPAQDIYRDDRAGIAQEVRDIVQSTIDDYGMGVQINAVSIEDASPPREVADAFDEVQRAEQDEDRFIEEANAYANQQLGQARGQAAQLREEAAAYRDRVVQEATGEAQRFVSVYDEYAKAPEVTRKRLFLETMEDVLNRSNKVIIERGAGSGVVPYLPLPEIDRRREQGQGIN